MAVVATGVATGAGVGTAGVPGDEPSDARRSEKSSVLGEAGAAAAGLDVAAAAAVAAALSLECGQRGVSTSTEIRMRTLE
mmetsp:Transcript_6284/g.12785  ORF Transcript_6284/g.12785 Transcript_6284/m.12785 type:complete len:80 (+) Transcript_6284:345-584(+)